MSESKLYLLACNERLTPPAIAALTSPLAIALQAKWMAVKEDEQAVSILRLGPEKLKK